MEHAPADDGGAGGQDAEDADCGLLRRRYVDLLQGDDGGIHQALPVGGAAFDHQENEQTRD